MTEDKRVRTPRQKDVSPDGIVTTQWDGVLKEGPGATTAAIPIVEVDRDHGGHILEPQGKRVLIGKDDILYPIAVSMGLVSALFGQSAGPHLANDMPEDETHPFFPDHFWPYPVIMMSMLIAMGLLSIFESVNMQLPAAASPTIVISPRPDWYFLWLFQFLKLGPETVMAIYIPTVIILLLLFWPFLDQVLGPRVARVLGWATWPVPGRNVITGTAWIVLMTWIAAFTFWALAGWTIFGIVGG